MCVPNDCRNLRRRKNNLRSFYDAERTKQTTNTEMFSSNCDWSQHKDFSTFISICSTNLEGHLLCTTATGCLFLFWSQMKKKQQITQRQLKWFLSSTGRTATVCLQADMLESVWGRIEEATGGEQLESICVCTYWQCGVVVQLQATPPPPTHIDPVDFMTARGVNAKVTHINSCTRIQTHTLQCQNATTSRTSVQYQLHNIKKTSAGNSKDGA